MADYVMELHRQTVHVEHDAVQGVWVLPGRSTPVKLYTLEDLPILLTHAQYLDMPLSVPKLTGNLARLFTVSKTHGKTGIPAGEYRVVLSYSQRFGRVLPELLNVPQFTGIRAHGGNTVADTLGCPLVGTRKTVARVSHCAPAVTALVAAIAKASKVGRVYVDVTNDFLTTGGV